MQMAELQQYCFGVGCTDILKWARRLVDRCHAPSIPTDIVMTAGAVSRLIRTPVSGRVVFRMNSSAGRCEVVSWV